MCLKLDIEQTLRDKDLMCDEPVIIGWKIYGVKVNGLVSPYMVKKVNRVNRARMYIDTKFISVNPGVISLFSGIHLFKDFKSAIDDFCYSCNVVITPIHFEYRHYIASGKRKDIVITCNAFSKNHWEALQSIEFKPNERYVVTPDSKYMNEIDEYILNSSMWSKVKHDIKINVYKFKDDYEKAYTF